MAVRLAIEDVGRSEIVERKIFGRALKRLEAPRPDEARNRHALGQVLLLVPLVEFIFELRGDISHYLQQSLRRRHRGLHVLRYHQLIFGFVQT